MEGTDQIILILFVLYILMFSLFKKLLLKGEGLCSFNIQVGLTAKFLNIFFSKKLFFFYLSRYFFPSLVQNDPFGYISPKGAYYLRIKCFIFIFIQF